ncbi:tetraspanin-7-like isoform X1 [Dermochelys coriacea]|uniref:tetraspanin-7-like isoform X1 n=1 Tax=Dermochelys coriacea TaxID=27794 RepID=UPI0018E6E441|nr:tetraspanin-7-like isoform X1 [Dermochelys coriacea]
MGPTQRCLFCLKLELFIFNLIFWLGGCGALGVGLWLALSQGRFSTLSLSLPSLGVAGLVMAAGAVVMALGFLGCLGAATEQRCLLRTFFVVLLTIILLELSGGLAFYACRGQFDRYAQDDLKLGLRRYGAPGEPALTQAWDTVQTEVSPPGTLQSPPASSPPCLTLLSPAVPVLRGAELHRLVRGAQRDGGARVLLPGARHPLLRHRCRLVEGALLREGEVLGGGERLGHGHFRCLHYCRPGPGPCLLHADVLPSAEGGEILPLMRGAWSLPPQSLLHLFPLPAWPPITNRARGEPQPSPPPA